MHQLREWLFLHFVPFSQLLWEEVQGVPAAVRPPEGVPGPHEPEMMVPEGGGCAGADSLWRNSDDESTHWKQEQKS